MDQRLHRDLTSGEIILNDRRAPVGGGNIDHVIIASSGVWVIDTKYWEGKVDYKGASAFGASYRLFVNGKDFTYLTDEIYAQVIPVAELLNDRSIPILPAIVFVNTDWKSTVRLATNKPYRHNHVVIAWPKALIAEIKRPGTLSLSQVSSVGSLLNEQLKPMYSVE
jgi:hypothetical protein